tara:strand:- start:39 stop:365 length:327 start_codon:yes stop_codon:yes gene_type:complete
MPLQLATGQEIYIGRESQTSGQGRNWFQIGASILKAGSVADEHSARFQHAENPLYRNFGVSEEVQDVQPQDRVERLLPMLHILKCGNHKAKVVGVFSCLSLSGDVYHS